MAEYGTPDHYEVTLDDETYTGAPLAGDEVTRIFRRHTKIRRVKGMLHEQTDDFAAGLEVFERTVTGWQGLTRDGEPLPCDPDGKRWLWRRHNDRCGEILEALDEARTDHRRGLEKN